MVNKILLKSVDGRVFEVEREVLRHTKTLNDMFQTLQMEKLEPDSAEAKEPIPVGNVKAATLEKVIEWCRHHKDDPAVDEFDQSKEHKCATEKIPSWDAEFLKLDKSELLDLIMASHFMEIEALFHFAGQTLADMIKDKTNEEIRAFFGIENDFTPEEEEQIRRDNAWAF